MAQKDVNGNYWLKYAEEKNICSQCEKPIIEGDKIFVDADGTYHKDKKMIEIGGVSIYHYHCIIESPSEDREPTIDDMM